MHRFILYYQASERMWSYQFTRDVTVERQLKATCFPDKTFCTFAVSTFLRFSCYYSKYISCQVKESVLATDYELTSLTRGGYRIFSRRGCTRLLLYFNTNKPQSFFLQNTSCIRKPRVISEEGGGGVRTPCTLPLDSPLLTIARQSTQMFLEGSNEGLCFSTSCFNVHW